MNGGPEGRGRRARQEEDAARVVDLADPARGDDANELQGHHLGAGVSIIVIDGIIA